VGVVDEDLRWGWLSAGSQLS
jgi:hypothetical protein